MTEYEMPVFEQEDFEAEEEKSKELGFLTFPVGEVNCALSVDCVAELIWDNLITPIPCVPDYYEGVCNWKGNIIPVVSMEAAAGNSAEPSAGQKIIIVVRSSGYECGFSVIGMPRMMNFSEKDAMGGEIPTAFGEILRIKGAYSGEDGPVYVIDEAELLNNLVVYS